MVYPRSPADQGPDVRAVQALLVYKAKITCPISGVYDLGTRNAVLWFQKTRSLSQTGNVDGTTFSVLTRG